MNEVSPKVALESEVLKIPVFLNNSSLLDFQSIPSTCLDSTGLSICQSNETQEAKATKKCSCDCPHVLIADDDPFEDFYYQLLFKEAIEFEGLPIKKEDFRFRTFSSGEDLLNKYSSVKDCSCGSCLLVITDFNMGLERLDGIATAQLLRKDGYTGSLILRTSEKQDDLVKSCPELDKLLETKTIDCLQDKTNRSKTKQTVYDMLKL